MSNQTVQGKPKAEGGTETTAHKCRIKRLLLPWVVHLGQMKGKKQEAPAGWLKNLTGRLPVKPAFLREYVFCHGDHEPRVGTWGTKHCQTMTCDECAGAKTCSCCDGPLTKKQNPLFRYALPLVKSVTCGGCEQKYKGEQMLDHKEDECIRERKALLQRQLEALE